MHTTTHTTTYTNRHTNIHRQTHKQTHKQTQCLLAHLEYLDSELEDEEEGSVDPAEPKGLERGA